MSASPLSTISGVPTIYSHIAPRRLNWLRWRRRRSRRPPREGGPHWEGPDAGTRRLWSRLWLARRSVSHPPGGRRPCPVGTRREYPPGPTGSPLRICRPARGRVPQSRRLRCPSGNRDNSQSLSCSQPVRRPRSAQSASAGVCWVIARQLAGVMPVHSVSDLRRGSPIVTARPTDSVSMEGELQTLDGFSFLLGKLRRENVELLNRGRLSE